LSDGRSELSFLEGEKRPKPVTIVLGRDMYDVRGVLAPAGLRYLD
jgi:hypothetical protein